MFRSLTCSFLNIFFTWFIIWVVEYCFLKPYFPLCTPFFLLFPHLIFFISISTILQNIRPVNDDIGVYVTISFTPFLVLLLTLTVFLSTYPGIPVYWLCLLLFCATSVDVMQLSYVLLKRYIQFSWSVWLDFVPFTWQQVGKELF